MAETVQYVALDDLCPKVGELVVDVRPTTVGGVEYAPCPRCEGAPAPVFHTSEGRFTLRYSRHVLRQRVTS